MHPYKDPRAPLQLATWMRSAGFVEVESRLITLPMCAWSRIIILGKQTPPRCKSFSTLSGCIL
ncbi:hypothetical protein S40285_01529 [Stachybotrys chlorohalonatus IBT 40285]|uniref:Uncharacterized protein n=1 Tax=Stachybotrys chlorohalonatus (strain IBT 40285) TaxID=1283841 RepID=A0A084QMT0_STAC4|nr:hypothetical protein S40285_01529 [Stachybotrys chlorohalonata IBT 40285]